MNMPTKQIRQIVDQQYECEISRSKAYKAKSKVRKSIKGSGVEQYTSIWEYVVELHKTHTNIKIDIQYIQKVVLRTFEKGIQ